MQTDNINLLYKPYADRKILYPGCLVVEMDSNLFVYPLRELYIKPILSTADPRCGDHEHSCSLSYLMYGSGPSAWDLPYYEYGANYIVGRDKVVTMRCQIDDIDFNDPNWQQKFRSSFVNVEDV